MAYDKAEYSKRIHDSIDQTYCGVSNYLEDANLLLEEWEETYRSTKPLKFIYEVRADGTSTSRRDDESGKSEEYRWKLGKEGHFLLSAEHKGIWYDDSFWFYKFSHDKLVQANEDASVVILFTRL